MYNRLRHAKNEYVWLAQIDDDKLHSCIKEAQFFINSSMIPSYSHNRDWWFTWATAVNNLLTPPLSLLPSRKLRYPHTSITPRCFDWSKSPWIQSMSKSPWIQSMGLACGYRACLEGYHLLIIDLRFWLGWQSGGKLPTDERGSCRTGSRNQTWMPLQMEFQNDQSGLSKISVFYNKSHVSKMPFFTPTIPFFSMIKYSINMYCGHYKLKLDSKCQKFSMRSSWQSFAAVNSPPALLDSKLLSRATLKPNVSPWWTLFGEDPHEYALSRCTLIYWAISSCTRMCWWTASNLASVVWLATQTLPCYNMELDFWTCTTIITKNPDHLVLIELWHGCGSNLFIQFLPYSGHVTNGFRAHRTGKLEMKLHLP